MSVLVQCLSPLEHALGKPLAGTGQGQAASLEAASTCELLGELGVAQGRCCSLGNKTQASSLTNSGFLHKTCCKVLSVPAGLEPLAALFAGGHSAVQGRLLSPHVALGGGSLFASQRGGQGRIYFSHLAWV